MSTRTEEEGLPDVLLYGYTHGLQGKGKLEKIWIDNIRADCTDLGIPLQELTKLLIWQQTGKMKNIVRKMGCQSARTFFSSSRIYVKSKFCPFVVVISQNVLLFS